MLLRFCWTATGTVTVDVGEQDAALMLDENNSASAPCDLDDLPSVVQELVRSKITDAIYDNVVEIDMIEEVVKKTTDKSESE